MSQAEGTRIGSYVITAKVGEGGMGEVYRARDTKLDRDVALKILPESFASDSDRVMRFEREAKTLASLNHPHIAQIYGFEHVAEAGLQTRLLVMELVDGEDLSQRIARGPIPIDEALPIAKQIAEALEAAHEAGIIHRDVKPANVKVRDDGTVKVLDFGLAKGSERGDQRSANLANGPTITSPAMTQAGIILGTAAYMSPEQAKGRFVDKRADIWAFGCVLYEMLTGQRAFAGDDITDTIVAVMSREPDWRALPAGTPIAVQRLLARCLKRDNKARVRDIGEARQLIEDVLTGDGTIAGGAHTNGATAAPQPAVSRLRVLPWAIAATTSAALLIVAAIGTPWGAEQPASRPLIRLDVDLGDEVSLFAPGSGGSSKAIAISPDGLRVAYVSGTPARAFIRRLDQPSSTEVAGSEGAADVFFSADGQWLGFAAGRKVSKVSVEGGAVAPIIDVAAYRGAVWAEDGSIFVGAHPNVVRIPPTGGPPETIAEAQQGELFVGSPHPLPGGNAILMIVDHAGGVDRTNIEVVTIADRRRRIIVRGAASPRYIPASRHLVYSRRTTLFAVPFDLTALDLAGSEVPIINDLANESTTGTGKFDVSPSGTMIYRKDRGDVPAPMTLQWFPDGQDKGWKLPPGRYVDLRLSPSGTHVALIVNDGRGNDLWLYDSGRDVLVPVTSDGRGVVSPLWSPDSRYIVFSVVAKGIHHVRADGSTPPQVLLQSTANQRPTSFSPDGKRIAYWESAGDGQIWTIPLEDDGRHLKAGKPEPFLADPVGNRYPSFSPDGRWLAYQSREAGTTEEVFVRAFPAPASGAGGRWQMSVGGGAVPRWLPTGDTLLYLVNDRIVAVPYTVKGDAFIAGKPRPWSGALPTVFGNLNAGARWDVSADSRRIAVLAPVQTAEPVKQERTIVFLQNFFDELRRRAPLPGSR